MSASVLLIGSNQAALTAALNLADAGVRVHLVERAPFLGQGSSSLAQPGLTSLMLQVVKHPNVVVYTGAQITSLTRETDGRRATILCRARYVDLGRCTACGDCVQACPVTIPRDGMEQKAVFGGGYGAVPNVFVIEKRGVAPCKAACPAGVHAQGYTALIAQGRFQEALDLIRQAVPFPGVLGRVCHHPCEDACRRGKEVDQPVAICALKRFVADWEAATAANSRIPQSPIRNPQSPVAIIGAGPAGLTAAYFLARYGVACQVFEALPVAGGMMAVGIPAYRLPRDVLQREIAAIQALGVTIHLNRPVDAAMWDRLRQEYAAIFLAIGAHQGQSLSIPGQDLEGVIPGVDFLRRVNLAGYSSAGQALGDGDKGASWAGGRPLGRVLVIGGGNVAIDSARVARRLGAEEVAVLYRRARADMPANPWEVAEAEEEGVHLQFGVAPVRALGQDGRLVALECVRMAPGAPDESGRPRPIPVPGSEFLLPCDTVIVAVGQRLTGTFPGLALSPAGTLLVDPITLQTNLPGVFAGGDAVNGPATVVEAIAAGRRAAEAIWRYLQGQDLALAGAPKQPDLRDVAYYMPSHPAPQPRAIMPSLPLAQRATFAEVALGLTKEQAIAEARRCLSCAVCSECLACVAACRPKAIDHGQKEETVQVTVDSIIVADARDAPEVADRVHLLPQDDAQAVMALVQQVLAELGQPTVIPRGKAAALEREPWAAWRPTPLSVEMAEGPRPPLGRCLGVVLCRCGDQVAGRLDIDALAAYARSLPGVVQVQALDFACNHDAATVMLEMADRAGLDGLILAACSCCSLDQVCYGCTYQRVRCKGLLLQGAGRPFDLRLQTPDLHPVNALSRLSVEFVNIREQCAWVHEDDPAQANAKARRLIAAAVAKAGLRRAVMLPTAVNVEPLRCRACGICQKVCEFQAIGLKQGSAGLVAWVNAALCQGCGTCAARCPSGAIVPADTTDGQIKAMLKALLHE